VNSFLLTILTFWDFGGLLGFMGLNPQTPQAPKQKTIQNTEKKFCPKKYTLLPFTFPAELFWTYLDFFGLFLTQPANESNLETKKQPKPARTKIRRKLVNKAKTRN
jgi:hypothetical protein